MRWPLVLGFGLAILATVSSCDEPEDTLKDHDGVIVRQPHLWKTATTDDSELTEVVIATPIIYDENLLVGARRASNRAILSLNSTNGHVNWEWNDLLGLLTNPGYKDPLTIRFETYYQNGGQFFFTYTSSSYCVNLATGQTVWKYKMDRHRFDRNAGIDDTYFTSGSNYEPIDDEKIYFGSITSPTPEVLLVTPEYTPVDNPPVNAQGHIIQMAAFKEDDVMYLAFGMENPYKDFAKEGWGFTELNLFNVTKRAYAYKKVVTNPAFETRGVSGLCYNNSRLFFQSAKYVHSYEALTGRFLWRTYVDEPPLLSRMLLRDNKLISAGEDRILYCLDAQTGQVLWKEQNTGTCTELSYLNGVLYYLGGGDGLLHAVDANSGKHLWKISSPDLQMNSGAWFYGVCTAVPGKDGRKGVVVATTGLHAYAYEAIR